MNSLLPPLPPFPHSPHVIFLFVWLHWVNFICWLKFIFSKLLSDAGSLSPVTATDKNVGTSNNEAFKKFYMKMELF